MSTTPLIATGLRHAYGNRPALAGIDLRIEPADFVVITGASGSGKSTLLHALAGVIVPDAGSVRFGDVSVSGASEEARSALRRTRFGVLFQFGQLVEELTAVENVALPLLLGGMPRRTAEARAGEWLGRVGVAEVAGQVPGELSGGQAQRVALARALVSEADILFADEPTGALDSLAAEAVMDLLSELNADLGATIVLVTHEPRVAAYGRTEVHLRDGRIDTLSSYGQDDVIAQALR